MWTVRNGPNWMFHAPSLNLITRSELSHQCNPSSLIHQAFSGTHEFLPTLYTRIMTGITQKQWTFVTLTAWYMKFRSFLWGTEVEEIIVIFLIVPGSKPYFREIRLKFSPVLDVAAPRALETDSTLQKKHENYWKLLKLDYWEWIV